LRQKVENFGMLMLSEENLFHMLWSCVNPGYGRFGFLVDSGNYILGCSLELLNLKKKKMSTVPIINRRA